MAWPITHIHIFNTQAPSTQYSITQVPSSPIHHHDSRVRCNTPPADMEKETFRPAGSHATIILLTRGAPVYRRTSPPQICVVMCIKAYIIKPWHPSLAPADYWHHRRVQMSKSEGQGGRQGKPDDRFKRDRSCVESCVYMPCIYIYTYDV